MPKRACGRAQAGGHVQRALEVAVGNQHLRAFETLSDVAAQVEHAAQFEAARALDRSNQHLADFVATGRRNA